MSRKIRKPNKNTSPLQAVPAPQQPQAPPLGGDANSLVTEWRRLQGLLAQVNVQIQEEQKKIQDADMAIKTLQVQGNQVLGATSSVSRILAGMGVNPEKYEVSAPAETSRPTALEVVEDEDEDDYPAEEPEVTSNFRSEFLRRRFNR
jgi:hypothetical protein